MGSTLCVCISHPAAAAAAKSLQSCPTLYDPIDGSPPGSPIPGVLQARTLEWVAISFSSAWKWKVKVKSLSCLWLLATPWTAAYQAPLSVGFSRQEYWSGVPLPSLISRSVMSNSLRPHGLYSLQVSSVYGILQARILEQVAISFSRVQPYCSSFPGGLCYSQKKKKKKTGMIFKFLPRSVASHLLTSTSHGWFHLASSLTLQRGPYLLPTMINPVPNTEPRTLASNLH